MAVAALKDRTGKIDSRENCFPRKIFSLFEESGMSMHLSRLQDSLTFLFEVIPHNEIFFSYEKNVFHVKKISNYMNIRITNELQTFS